MFHSLPNVPTLILSSAFLLLTAPATTSGHLPQEPTAAPPVPAAPAVNNPVKPSTENQARAKRTYGFDCVMCHGANGDGKTDLARDMKLTMTDWTDPKALAGKTDGELFQAIRYGKDKMPAEDASRAKDDDVWNLVTYARNMAKKEKTGATSGR